LDEKQGFSAGIILLDEIMIRVPLGVIVSAVFPSLVFSAVGISWKITVADTCSGTFWPADMPKPGQVQGV
jgi:hypothetical protein